MKCLKGGFFTEKEVNIYGNQNTNHGCTELLMIYDYGLYEQLFDLTDTLILLHLCFLIVINYFFYFARNKLI